MKYLAALLVSCNLISDYTYIIVIKDTTFVCETSYDSKTYGDCVNTRTKEQFSQIVIGNNITVWRKTK